MSEIDEMIAKSSIGRGLANIRENGIDAELDVLDDERATFLDRPSAASEDGDPKKRRKKSTSPTARTLAECRKRGWTAGVVERHIPFPRPQGTTIDLFGVIDLVAIVGGEGERMMGPRYQELLSILIDDVEAYGAGDEDDRANSELQLEFVRMLRAIKARPARGFLAIQATASAAHHAHRRNKILAEPRAKEWVGAGGRLEIWSWAKQGGRGKRKKWTLRVETYEEMLASRERSP